VAGGAVIPLATLYYSRFVRVDYRLVDGSPPGSVGIVIQGTS
jgi:hypothetical protein